MKPGLIALLVVGVATTAGWFMSDIQNCGVGTPCGKLLTVEEVEKLTGVSARSPSVSKYTRNCSAIYHDSAGQELLTVGISKDAPYPMNHSNFTEELTRLRAEYAVEPVPGFDAEAYGTKVPAFVELLLQRAARGVDGTITIEVHHDRTKPAFEVKDLAKLVPLITPRLKLADEWLAKQSPQ
jgi:hypothetical protein